MAISLKHAFISAIPDDGDTSRVRPSDWNNNHVLTQSTGFMLGRLTAGTGATEEISAAALMAWSGAVAKAGDEMSGGLTINKTGGSPSWPFAGSSLQISGNAGASSILLVNYGGPVGIYGARAQGTVGAPLGVSANATLCVFSGYAYDGANWSSGPRAAVTLLSAETWGPAAQGTRIRFSTTPLGSTTQTNRMHLEPNGALNPGVTDDSGSIGETTVRWNNFQIGTGNSRIDGRLGIGQLASGSAKLQITTAAAGIAVSATDATYGTFQIRFSASTGVEFGSTGGSNMNFLVNNTVRMTLDTSGNMLIPGTGSLTVGATVGIGKFNVRGGRSLFEANSEIYATSLSYGAGLGVIYQGATNSATPDYVLSNNAGVSLLWFTYSGNFGLNTAFPNLSSYGKAVTINATNAGDIAVLELASAGTLRARAWANNGGYYHDAIGGIPMVFRPDGGTEMVRFATATGVTFSTGRVTGVSDATAVANYRAGTLAEVLTAKTVWDAAAIVALTDAATIAVDMATGVHFSVTVAGNRTLGAPTNVKPGQSGLILVTQDATGGRTLVYNSVYKFAGGTAPVIDNVANRLTALSYFCVSSSLIIISAQNGVR